MGWGYDHKPRGLPIKEYFRKTWEETREKKEGVTVKTKLLECKVVEKVAYMAIEWLETGKDREVFAVVSLLDWWSHAKDHWNFGHKDIGETSGPCACLCPKEVFKHLTPTTSQYALKWRKKCQAYIDRAPLKEGHFILFNKPIEFESGSFQCFKIEKKGGLRRKTVLTRGNQIYHTYKEKTGEYRTINPKKLKEEKELPLLLNLHPELDAEISTELKSTKELIK